MKVESYSVGQYVRVIDDVFEERFIDKFLEICDTLDFVPSRVGEGRIDEKIRTAFVFDFTRFLNKLTLVHWNNFFVRAINITVGKYFLPLIGGFGVEPANWFQLLKYKEGGFYETHVDHAKNTPRSLSVIIFLNDDYEGGELELFSPDREQSQKIKPKKGRMVIWPSNFLYPHKANPVKKGTRYAIVCWLE